MLLSLKKILIILFVAGFGGAHAQVYERIVSLAPSLTQELYLLNVQDKIAGCTSYCEIAKKDNKTVVASPVKLNLEKIVSVKPDLVLASGFTNKDDIESLKKFGIKVVVFLTPKSFAEICTQFNELGNLLGKRDVANAIIAQSNQKVIFFQKKASKNAHPKIFFQIGANPLFTVIPNTFMNDYITYCGGVNVASDLKRGSISRETVLSRNPDYVFIVTMGIVGNEEKTIWEKYSYLKATQQKNIHIIDSELACIPTPLNFVKTLEIINEIMQK